ncbi:hypothetical protein CK203_053448 [Vitis vinifera]|uniref:Uncharacterized protein n=1 Tax=Vitis vinifera TaxID=29760 RepID=A0A438GYX2_VITVI|nr:hypothetical protein CK203_053448 [Vitis vinifera]
MDGFSLWWPMSLMSEGQNAEGQLLIPTHSCPGLVTRMHKLLTPSNGQTVDLRDGAPNFYAQKREKWNELGSMDVVERASLCNCVVNFLLEEKYLLSAFELLHELLEDGREAQAIRLKEFFSDPSHFPPDQISRFNSLRVGWRSVFPYKGNVVLLSSKNSGILHLEAALGRVGIFDQHKE